MSIIPAAIQKAASLDDALAATIAQFGADSGTVHILGPDGALHLRAATRGIPQTVLDNVRVVPVGKGLAGLAVERLEPVTVCNIQTDTSGDVRPNAKLTGLEGAIVVPMLHNDVARGALGIANYAERTFSPEETTLLLAIGSLLAERHG